MNTRNLSILSLGAFLALSACTNDEDYSTIENPNALMIEVTDELAQKATRVDYSGFPVTTFEEGDAIGVYALSGTTAIASNVKFTKQADGSWLPASAVVYNPDYTYYAYYPWVSSTPTFSSSGSGADGKFANFTNNSTFWKSDQSSKANFTASNLMWAQGVVTGTRTVKFTMVHKRGLAIISGAVNQWYYANNTSTKYTLTPVITGNIPYTLDGTRYFLMYPNTLTSVAGLSLRAAAGKYMYSNGIELTGNPSSFSYQRSTNNGSSWSSTSKPEWLTINPIVEDGQPTNFEITETGGGRNVPGDAILKAAAPVGTSEAVDLSMVNNDGTARASRTTANCYLVHAPGNYKLPLVYGNAIKNGDDTQTTAFYTPTSSSYKLQRLQNHTGAGITTPWIKTQIGSCPDGARLIWQDVKGLISSVGIDTSDNGYLTFTVDEDNIAEGNAVIAATLSGTVVWSWHIWVTPEDLSNTTVVAATHTYTVAPLNVGSVNGTYKLNAGTAGEICRVTVNSNGMTMTFDVPYTGPTQSSMFIPYPSPYYQWGRKDAMMPATGAYDIDGNAIASYSSSAGTYLTSGTIADNIKNPDKWYNVSSKPHSGTAYNYWDMNQTGTENISTATVKTVYDPCPPGFCVPTGNLYYYMGNTGSSNSSYGTWDSTNKTRTWIYNGASLVFLASGYRNYSNGSLRGVGSSGFCWSASAYNSYIGRCLYFGSGGWTWYYDSRSYGCAVRAVAEE